jgi:hypothetical protein
MRSFLVIPAIILSTLLASCCTSQQTPQPPVPDALGEPEQGQIVRDGQSLHVVRFPRTIQIDDAVDPRMAASVVAWWNLEMSRDGVSRAVFDAWDGEGDPDITVHYEVLQPNILGLAGIRNTLAGEIVTPCRIRINVRLVIMPTALTETLRHELGHCIGLDDDPIERAAPFLNSIMEARLPRRGNLTHRDFFLLRRMYDRARRALD